MNKTLAGTFALAVLLLQACQNDDVQQNNNHPKVTQKEVNEGLIKSHQMYVKQEQDEIAQYIKRHNYDMQATSTGIYYMFTEHGKGEQATVGDVATVTYNISLLDGTVCYDSKNAPIQVLIGKDIVETGVHQSLQL